MGLYIGIDTMVMPKEMYDRAINNEIFMTRETTESPWVAHPIENFKQYLVDEVTRKDYWDFLDDDLEIDATDLSSIDDYEIQALIQVLDEEDLMFSKLQCEIEYDYPTDEETVIVGDQAVWILARYF